MRRVSYIIAGAGVPALVLSAVASSALAGRLAPRAAPSTASTASMRAQARPATTMHVAISQHYGKVSNASGYSVILRTGRQDAWALGGTNPGGNSRPVAVQWNGRTATPAALPSGLTGFITDAAATSARNVWAVSAYGQYLLHWNGQAWRLARRWHRGPITGLAVLSARNVWIFGTTPGGLSGTGTWHYDGQSWRRVAGQAADIYRASAVSWHDIWAITANGTRDSVIRYGGRNWRAVPGGRALTGVSMRDILAISDRDVWVVGTQTAKGATRLVLAHWNGRTWIRLATRANAWPGRLVRGRNGVVLVTATSVHPAATGLILQAWARGWGPTIAVASPFGSGVSDVAAFQGRSVWAVGGMLTRLGGNAVIWHADLGRPADRDDLQIARGRVTQGPPAGALAAPAGRAAGLA